MYYIDRRVEVNDALMTPDGSCEASISAIVNYFQNCCSFQSEDLGIGVEYLAKIKKVWVLNNWQIEVDRFPKYAEKIRIYTNPYEIKGFMGFRNFFILDSKDQMIVKANSIWTYLSLENERPIKADSKMIDAYVAEPRLEMEYAPRKIIVPEGGQDGKSIEILPQHLDMNMHVNNSQYISMAYSCLPMDFRPYHMRAEYKSQVRLGQILTPYIVKADIDTYVIALRNKEDEIVTIVEFKA